MTTTMQVAQRIAAKVFELRSKQRRNVEVHLNRGELEAILLRAIELAIEIGAVHTAIDEVTMSFPKVTTHACKWCNGTATIEAFDYGDGIGSWWCEPCRRRMKSGGSKP